MDKKIGFIGCGNMATAMISGLLHRQYTDASNILIFDRKPATLQAMQQQYQIQPMQSLQQIARESDLLIIAVKPNATLDVLSSINQSLNADSIIISVAAGVTLNAMAMVLNPGRKIIRLMPNTPALVGEGMTSVTPNEHVSQQECDDVIALCNSFGQASLMPEALIHTVVAVSGSAPAYIFMLLEAMADAAVLGGMPRQLAYHYAAQAVKGAARMVQETGLHPAELKDKVCSPAGTTITALKTLEEKGLRPAIIEAMMQCMAKSAQMSEH